MKKLATLLLAAGMVLGGFAGAQAIDWKVKGEWQFEFGYVDGGALTRTAPGYANSRMDGHRRQAYGAGWRAGRNTDNFTAAQRVRLQVDAVASESLSGQVFFEIGATQWGQEGSGGALGQRQINVRTRRAFLDFIVPQTDLKIRMGIQGLALPSFTFGSGVFSDDVAAVAASYKFNDNVSLTAFWARPYNDNFLGYNGTNAPGHASRHTIYNQLDRNAMDNVDVFGLVLPLAFDGFKITPWVMGGWIGPNAFRAGSTNNNTTPDGLPVNAGYVAEGMFPAYVASTKRRAGGGWNVGQWPWGPLGLNPEAPDIWRSDNQYAFAWWAGLTGEITAADPFRFAWDFNYGSVTHQNASYLNRSGWFLNVLAEYKLDWGVPGIYAWWGSGDDSNPSNGSERMPVLSDRNTDMMLSTFGYKGSPSFMYYDGGTFGSNYAGTWGIGVRIRDMSFLEDLKHTLRVNFMGGTNSPAMAAHMLGKKPYNRWQNLLTGDILTIANTGRRDFNVSTLDGSNHGAGAYLTTRDYALEVNLDTVYKIYENLDLMLELGYIHLWLDKGTWGSGIDWNNGGPTLIRGASTTDAIKVNLMFRYSF